CPALRNIWRWLLRECLRCDRRAWYTQFLIEVDDRREKKMDRRTVMKLSQIHHVAIIVSDYEVSKDFYVNKLGFAIIRENYRPEKDDWKLDIRVNDTTELEIFGVKNPP